MRPLPTNRTSRRRSRHRATGTAVALAAVCAVLSAAGCAWVAPPEPAQATPQSAPVEATGTEPRVITTGLEVPWGLAFLPDGSALVTERRSARISRVAPDGRVTPVGTVAGVAPQGEGGLLGIAVSPAYTDDRAVFVSFTAATDNRVVRLTAARDGTIDGTQQQPVVTGIPKASIHNGGGLAFGPDGLLYVSTGDAGRRDPAQDRADLGGKILRVTPDGAPAPGNPFGTAVYSYGHRNPQGLAWDPQGRLWATEFGQNTYDEVNLITPGGNYGWPVVEGVEGRAGYIDPLVQWTTDEASPSGLAIAGGALYVGALRGERIWRVPLAADGRVGTPEALLRDRFGRIRAATTAPDGRSVWFTTSNRDGRGSPAADDDRIVVLPVG